jgi:hypothetical protein
LIKRANEEAAARQAAATKVASAILAAKPKKWFKKAALTELGKKTASKKSIKAKANTGKWFKKTAA